MLASAALSLGATAAQAAFVVLILARNPRGRTSHAFLILMTAHILWCASETVVRLYPDAPYSTLGPWLRVQWTGLSLLPAGVLYFAMNFPYPSPLLRRRWVAPVIFLPSLIFIILVWTGDTLVTGVAQTPLGPDAAAGSLYPLGVSVVSLWLILADFRLGRIVYKRWGRADARAAVIVFFGFAHTHVLGIGTDALLPVISGAPVRSGLASIYLLDLAAFVAYAVYRYRILIIEPERELTYPAYGGFPLKEGVAQLILCGAKDSTYQGFRTLAARIPALCVTATPPAVVARRYQLDRTPILWLTKVQDQPRALKPWELKFEVLRSLSHALEQSPKMAILVDDVDYLANTIGFGDTAGFLKSLYDRCSRAGSTLVVPVHPSSLEPKQLALLEQMFDRVEDLKDGPEVRPSSDPRSLLALGSRMWCWSVLKGRGTNEDGIVVTPLHPFKYRSLVGAEAAEVLWLSDDMEAGTVSPVGLDVGLGRTLRRWMQDHPQAPVLVEGLEYLLTVNRLPEVLDLVKGLVDSASITNNLLIFALRPEAVDPQVLTLLALRCEASLQEEGKLKGG